MKERNKDNYIYLKNFQKKYFLKKKIYINNFRKIF